MSKTSDNKPYKTYSAGRGRPRKGDEDLLVGRSKPRRSASKRGAAARQQTSKRGAPLRQQAGNNGTPPYERQHLRRWRFRWWHIPVGMIAILLIAIGGFLIWAWPKYDAFAKAVEAANKRLPASAYAQLTPDGGSVLSHSTTILLLGIDDNLGISDSLNPEGPPRTDTIMLLRVNPSKHTVTQLSIPRDTRVNLGQYGYSKINAAYHYGGPALAISTIKSFASISINHVMVVDFQGFRDIVDAVGGVRMYVPETVHTIRGGGHTPITFPKGWYDFDGRDAMLYVRARKQDDDFHRMARQQIFMKALQKKLVQFGNLPKLPDIARKFMWGVATDLKPMQMLELAYLKWRTPAKNTKSLVMLGTPQYIGGQDYVVVTPNEANKYVGEFLGN